MHSLGMQISGGVRAQTASQTPVRDVQQHAERPNGLVHRATLLSRRLPYTVDLIGWPEIPAETVRYTRLVSPE